MNNNQTYIALLRGINVGGHHKVPMADLRKEMGKLGFENVQTLLNSGNIIFDGPSANPEELEEDIAVHLETVFGFSIPTLLRKEEKITKLINADPFKDIESTKDIRLYATFIKEKSHEDLSLPWVSEDEAFRITGIWDRAVCSVLDLSASKTTEAMKVLEQLFGKDITTRNWNTVNRIFKKLDN